MYLLPTQKTYSGKAVASALSEISKTPCSPANPPEAGFFLGGCTVSPKGIVSLPDSCNTDEAGRLCQQLLLNGFSYYPSEESPLLENGNNIPVDTDARDDFVDPRLANGDGVKYLTLSLDRGDLTDYDLQKLQALVDSKASLLKKTLSAENLVVTVQENKVFFPWFIDNGVKGEIQAYLDLIIRLVYHARCSKRITAKDHPSSNEKRQMGIFLTTLGISAREYPRSRYLLLRNLKTDSTDLDYLDHNPDEQNHLPAPRLYLPGQSLINNQK